MGPADLLTGAALPGLTGHGRPSAPVVVVDLDRHPDWDLAEPVAAALREAHVPVVGFASRPLPEAAAALLRSFTLTLAPGGPGRCWARGDRADLDALVGSVEAAPLAAFTLANLLLVTDRLPVAQALAAESAAYSTLLGGPEFADWLRGRRAGRGRRAPSPAGPDAGRQGPGTTRLASLRPEPGDEPVLVTRDGDLLRVRLHRPDRHNAYDARMRDGLLQALDVAVFDPGVRLVELTGSGRSFCSGGDLDEFGVAADPATAHLVRLRGSVGAVLHRLADRVRPVLHGACIGAGVELPSFARHVVARPGTWFQLPELRMGLLPGAGGTVSLPRRIGRWRTARLALSGAPLELGTALSWGLVDSIADDAVTNGADGMTDGVPDTPQPSGAAR